MKKWMFMLGLLPFGLMAAEDAPAAGQGQLYQTLIMFAIIIAFFYLIIWRPERRRRKVLETMRESLKKGDKVVSMGIVGTVSQIKKETIVLKMVDGAKIEVLKGAVSELSTIAEESE